MKNNNRGLTLIELIFSIVLLTIILLFLYVLINNLLFKEKNTEFDDAVSSALIMENVNEDLIKYGLAYNNNQNEIYQFEETGDLWSKVVFNTINGKSILSVQKTSGIKSDNERYKVMYLDTNGKEYVWELGEKMYPGNISIVPINLKEEGYSDENVILKITVPIYSTTGTYNVEGNNDYKDDITIEYYGTPQKIVHAEIEDPTIEEIPDPKIESSDGIGSNELHKNEFTLKASGSGENVKYTWLIDEKAVHEGEEITIDTETDEQGQTYTVKACPSDIATSSTLCKQTDYVVVFVKDKPQEPDEPVVIPVPDKPNIISSDNITSGNTHTSNFYLQVENPLSDVTYNWSGATNYTGNSVYVSSETDSSVYFLQACNSSGCSASAQYIAVLKKDSSGGGGSYIPSAPSAPTITASDYISSGSWHSSNFNLTAYSSGATYYVWSGGSTSSSSSIYVSNNTSSTTYYVKACNSGGCSGETSYVVKLDTIEPSCSISYNKSSSSGDTYTKGYWTQFNVYITLNCSDNLTSSSSLSYSVTSNTSSVSGSGSSRYISREGEHYVSISVKDAAQNSYSDSATIKIDKTAPSCSLYTTTGDYYSNGGTSGTSSTSAVYVELKCSDSLSGMDSGDKMIYKNGSASGYGSKLKMTSSGTVSYKANDIVGNSVTGSTKTITIKTCTTSSSYTQSCSPSSTVTCSGSYTKKTTYKAQDYDPQCDWISDGTVSRTTTPSSVYSCSESYDAGNIKYTNKTCISCKKGGAKYAPRCSTPSNNTCNKWKWTVKKCKCNPKFIDYTSTSTYVTAGTCSKSGTKGTDKTYVRCTTGYTKKTVTTCS